MSSWWPILDTPKSSSSWWVIRNSWSPPTFSLSKVLMYCCRQSSSPEGTTQDDRKTFSTVRQGDSFVPCRYRMFWFLVKTSICIMCSGKAWNRFPCQNMCCKSLKSVSTGCILLCPKCETVRVKQEIWLPLVNTSEVHLQLETRKLSAKKGAACRCSACFASFTAAAGVKSLREAAIEVQQTKQTNRFYISCLQQCFFTVIAGIWNWRQC